MPIPLYPEMVMRQDLSPDHGFGPEIDDCCQQIHDATKGWGANKQKVVDALAKHNATDRYKLYIRYKELHKQDLEELMKKEFSGNFGLALRFLALPLHKAECKMIRKATAGVGANVNIVWSVLVGRTNEELELLKKTYYDMYSKDLGKVLASELTGNMEVLVFSALQGGQDPFDPQHHTKEKAIEDAEEIYQKGQGKWGTEERGIFKILTKSLKEHLQAIDRAYSEKYGYTLAKAMAKELNGNLADATVHLIEMKLKPYEAMANLIKTACKGIGTDELLLTCTLIRLQEVMGDVMAAHIELYGKTVHDRVRSEVKGNFRDLLLHVLDTAWPEQG
ncbi:hypothetical protein MPSEU_001016300 [Mayamaea pseudoterrestris]|nr:hypothetical protein MPSEU_001016300 [Mayamaea pseudoterrestris]